MTSKVAGRGELAELVTDHLLGDVHRDELVPVVNGDRMADKVRRDHAGTGPGLDHFLLLATIIHSKNSLLQGFLDIGTFS